MKDLFSGQMKDLFSKQKATLKERISRKQDNTEKTLAQLVEEQMKLLERGIQMPQSFRGPNEATPNNGELEGKEGEKEPQIPIPR